jgi:hypothetical protein
MQKNSPKNSAGGQEIRCGSGYEKSYRKYSEPEASSGLSLHGSASSSTLFSHFVLPAFGLPRWRQGQKTARTVEKHAQNRG